MRGMQSLYTNVKLNVCKFPDYDDQTVLAQVIVYNICNMCNLGTNKIIKHNYSPKFKNN